MVKHHSLGSRHFGSGTHHGSGVGVHHIGLRVPVGDAVSPGAVSVVEVYGDGLRRFNRGLLVYRRPGNIQIVPFGVDNGVHAVVAELRAIRKDGGIPVVRPAVKHHSLGGNHCRGVASGGGGVRPQRKGFGVPVRYVVGPGAVSVIEVYNNALCLVLEDGVEGEPGFPVARPVLYLLGQIRVGVSACVGGLLTKELPAHKLLALGRSNVSGRRQSRCGVVGGHIARPQDLILVTNLAIGKTDVDGLRLGHRGIRHIHVCPALDESAVGELILGRIPLVPLVVGIALLVEGQRVCGDKVLQIGDQLRVVGDDAGVEGLGVLPVTVIHGLDHELLVHGGLRAIQLILLQREGQLHLFARGADVRRFLVPAAEGIAVLAGIIERVAQGLGGDGLGLDQLAVEVVVDGVLVVDHALDVIPVIIPVSFLHIGVAVQDILAHTAVLVPLLVPLEAGGKFVLNGVFLVQLDHLDHLAQRGAQRVQAQVDPLRRLACVAVLEDLQPNSALGGLFFQSIAVGKGARFGDLGSGCSLRRPGAALIALTGTHSGGNSVSQHGGAVGGGIPARILLGDIDDLVVRCPVDPGAAANPIGHLDLPVVRDAVAALVAADLVRVVVQVQDVLALVLFVDGQGGGLRVRIQDVICIVPRLCGLNGVLDGRAALEVMERAIHIVVDGVGDLALILIGQADLHHDIVAGTTLHGEHDQLGALQHQRCFLFARHLILDGDAGDLVGGNAGVPVVIIICRGVPVVDVVIGLFVLLVPPIGEVVRVRELTDDPVWALLFAIDLDGLDGHGVSGDLGVLVLALVIPLHDLREEGILFVHDVVLAAAGGGHLPGIHGGVAAHDSIGVKGLAAAGLIQLPLHKVLGRPLGRLGHPLAQALVPRRHHGGVLRPVDVGVLLIQEGDDAVFIRVGQLQIIAVYAAHLLIAPGEGRFLQINRFAAFQRNAQAVDVVRPSRLSGGRKVVACPLIIAIGRIRLIEFEFLALPQVVVIENNRNFLNVFNINRAFLFTRQNLGQIFTGQAVVESLEAAVNLAVSCRQCGAWQQGQHHGQGQEC